MIAACILGLVNRHCMMDNPGSNRVSLCEHLKILLNVENENL